MIKFILSSILFLSIAQAEPVLESTWHGPLLPAEWGQAKNIFLYDDVGVWHDGREHLKMFFIEHQLSYRTVTAEEIKNGALENASILVMPGGQSWRYLESLGDSGAEAIRLYVARGGGYIGICAGAFYATAFREGGQATGRYGIGLLNGTAFDGTALKYEPFKDGMLDFTVFIPGLLNTYRIVLFGGPTFRYSNEEATQKNIQVLARFPVIKEPAMISFRFGRGHVFLSGPHLEIEENRTSWGEEFQDPESDWPILYWAATQVQSSQY